MTFKEKIVRLRKIKSLTQDEFASAVGVSRQAVYKWESGQSYPEVQKLIEIKMLFGISIDDLLDDTYEVEMPEKKRKKRAANPKKEEVKVENAEQTPVPVSEIPENSVPEEVKEEVTEEVAEDTAAEVTAEATEEATEEAVSEDAAEKKTTDAASEEVEEKAEEDAPYVSEGNTEAQEAAEEQEPEVKEETEEKLEQTVASVTTEEKAPEESEKKKKGFFSRMFSKK